MPEKRFPRGFIKALGRVLYHVLLVALSVGIAFSLPFLVSFTARNFLPYWSMVQSQKIILIATELTLALLLVILFNYVGRSWTDRKFAKMARGSGMVHFFPTRGLFAQRKIRKLKKKQGYARDMMIISSTGFRTLVDVKGDLHDVLKNCREAKVMLLNPYSEGARARADGILDPGVTVENFHEQVRKSIEFLKGLKALQKHIRLKLYGDTPFLRLAILGDYAWIKHYHPGLDVQSMPECVFERQENLASLYTPFYRYFLARWEDFEIPEYDLGTDELVYRDGIGNEIKREKFDMVDGANGTRRLPQDAYHFSPSSVSQG